MPLDAKLTKRAGAGSINVLGTALTTTTYGQTVVAPPTGQSLPRLTGTPYPGETITVDASMLTNVTSTQFRNAGADLVVETGTSITSAMMQVLTCVVVADEGTFETPPFRIMHNHANAGHRTIEEAGLALTDHGRATHIQVVDGGLWTDPATWDVAQVPGNDARVLVPEGMTCIYDQSISPRIKCIRIDGRLEFDIPENVTRDLLIDTMIVQPTSGELIIGDSVTNRVPASTTVTITFTNKNYSTDSGPTDINVAEDPQLLGRGLVNFGTRKAFGVSRDGWARMTMNSFPMPGDTTLQFDAIPAGWEVGDRIIVPGTRTDMPKEAVQYFGSTNLVYDEEFTITGITGTTINLDGTIQFPHDADITVTNKPDWALPICNPKRNIIIRSEPGASVHQRGHIATMGEGTVTEMWGVAYYQMGRTDKSKPAGQIVNGQFKYIPIGLKPLSENAPEFVFEPVTGASNIQGRYAEHGHLNGLGEDVVCDFFDLHIEDTPGWAAVHHGGRQRWVFGSIYKFQGAGLVSEDSSELGVWDKMLCFGLRSTCASIGHPKGAENAEAQSGDVFRRGYGFPMKSRSLVVTDCVAVGCSYGFNFHHRKNVNGFNDTVAHNRANVDVHDVGWWLREGTSIDDVSATHLPIGHFVGNESIGCWGGLSVTKSLGQQNHDLNIIISDFRAIGSVRGIGLEYILAYLIENVDLTSTSFFGLHGNPGTNDYAGVTMHKTQQLAFRNITTRGFREGIRTDTSQPPSSPNAGAEFNNTDNPKIVIKNHTSIEDQAAIGGEQPDWPDVTLLLPSNHVEIARPSVNIPFVIARYNGLNPDFDNFAGGFKTDSISSVRPIPKGTTDAAGLIHGGPAGGNQTQGTKRRRVFDVLAAYGYWTEGGKNIIPFDAYFSDSLTAMPIKSTHAVEINPNQNLNGYTSNGPFQQTVTPPTMVNEQITVVVPQDTPVTFNAITLADVTVEAGATATLGRPWMNALYGPRPALFQPNRGKIEATEAGSVTFTPRRGYVGPDSCKLFICDGRTGWLTLEVLFDIQAA